MSLYAVYDKATKAIVKTGIAANPDDCDLQNDSPAHAVASAENGDEMDALKAQLGLHE